MNSIRIVAVDQFKKKFLICSGVAFVIYVVYKYSRKKTPYILPGSLPILGHSLFNKTALIFDTIKHSRFTGYGLSVFRIPFLDVHVISSFYAIRELFLKKGSTSKTRHPRTRMLIHRRNDECGGILAANGSVWHHNRKLVFNFLRSLDKDSQLDSPSRVEKCIFEEAHRLRDRLINEDFIDAQMLLTKSVANLIIQLIYGRVFDYEDDEFCEVVKSILRFSALSGGFSDLITKLSKYIPIFRRFNEIQKCSDCIDRFITKYNVLHLHDDKETILNVTTSSGLFDDEELIMKNNYFMVRDMFLAGTETTASTMYWAVLLLGLNPKVVEEARKELKSKALDFNSLRVSDVLNRLPYCRAVVYEIQRFGCVATGSLSHILDRGIHVDGDEFFPRSFDLNKGSFLLYNIQCNLFDPNVWSYAQEFNPQNFLQSKDDGSIEFVCPEQFIPFGIGPRVCAGRKLAVAELCVYILMIITSFDIEIENPDPQQRLQRLFGVTSLPCNYKAKFHLIN